MMPLLGRPADVIEFPPVPAHPAGVRPWPYRGLVGHAEEYSDRSIISNLRIPLLPTYVGESGTLPGCRAGCSRGPVLRAVRPARPPRPPGTEHEPGSARTPRRARAELHQQ